MCVNRVVVVVFCQAVFQFWDHEAQPRAAGAGRAALGWAAGAV